MKKAIVMCMLFIVSSMLVFGGPEDFEKKIKTIRIPTESDFKGVALSEVLSTLSKLSNISIVASSEIADVKIDLYLPANSNLEKIIETIKTTNGLIGEIKNDTLILKRADMRPMLSYYKSSIIDMMAIPRSQGEFNTAEFGSIYENRFHKTVLESLSTFSIDVNKASYSVVRNEINGGRFPGKNMVRVEELINYFNYDYPEPDGKVPFSVNTELGDCDWNDAHKLALIQIKGKKIKEKALPQSNLVFLVDVSGSMGETKKLPLVISALKLLTDNLDSEDCISIVVYASSEGLALPPTKGKEKQKIVGILDKLSSGGTTAGGAGLKLAYKLAEENFIKNGNNRVILCTDGDFNVGISDTGSMVDIVQENKKKGIYLTIVGVGTDNLKDNRMEQMADKGDGNYYFLDNITEAKKIFVDELRGTLFTIAKDVKIQVEFNPAMIKEYKLIGYENRMLNNEDFKNDKKDAGDLGAGHTVTAIYELIMNDGKTEIENNLKYMEKNIKKDALNSKELMTVKLRYKEPEESESKEIEKIVKDDIKDLKECSKEFMFASSVAEFGLLLRDSEYRESASYEKILKLARAGKGEDYFGYRAEFIRLAETCQLLDRRDLNKLYQEQKRNLKIIEKEISYNKKPLKDVAEELSKVIDVKFIAHEKAKEELVNLSIPKNLTIKEILEKIRKDIGFLYREEDGTYTMSNKEILGGLQIVVYSGRVMGKVTEDDGITPIKGVLLSLGDDVNTLVMSDVGGVFIMENIKPGIYVLKVVAKGYTINYEIMEMKSQNEKPLWIRLKKDKIP